MIKKFQYGNPLIAANEQRNYQVQSFINNGLKQVGTQARQAEARNAQLRKADARANKKTKAPMQSNNLARLQDQLWKMGAFKGLKDRKGRDVTYETAIDGIKGGMTDAAIANAQKMGYTVNSNGTLQQQAKPQQAKSQTTPKAKGSRFVTTSGAYLPAQVIERATQSIGNNPKAQNVADFLAHNPGMILLEDIDRANSNRLTEALFGVRPFKGRTITSLPTLQMEELKKQVQFAKSKGRNGFDSEMYRQMYGYNYGSRNGANGQDRSGFWNRMSTPSGRLEHTLGAYGFYTDEQGNTIVHDIYDYNVGQRQGGDGRYAATRNFAGEFASKSTDPNEGKIKYSINLGKL